MLGSTPRTRKRMSMEVLGPDKVSWLGPLATLEEVCVAVWLHENGYEGRYIYQGFFGGFRSGIYVDFLILGTAPQLVLEVQGDRYHSTGEQRTLDRERRILVEGQGAIVVEIAGHDIIAYPGHPVPTDASFHRVMELAMRGIQVSRVLS